jgi:hypothetical protein
LLPAGNGFLFFFLIVFTFTLPCGWKTGVLLWIPRELARWAERLGQAEHNGQGDAPFCGQEERQATGRWIKVEVIKK